MIRFLSLFLVSFMLLVMPVQAQDGGKTILVFDASGSMWGQIDGKAKVTIAQEVIGELLNSIPEHQALGLTAYGHRRKGDCSDIETLVAPATGTRNEIARAVNAIKPKGKTPLSAAVIAAAEVLKYTENKATVILVSDGRETCDFDPCEVGRALEEAGVDFTAHVIGFDVAKKADRAQLQCLAENTGGVFRTASNAAELTEALKVVAKPAPAQDVQVGFMAIDGAGGPTIFSGLVWTLSHAKTGDVFVDMVDTDTLLLKLKPGTYKAEVLRIKDEAYAQLVIAVNANGGGSYTLVLPEFKPLATLVIPDVLVAGSTVQIGWTGPGESRDYLSVANEGDRGSQTLTYGYTADGQPTSLMMPPLPGEYELRYILNESSKILASQKIQVVPFEVTVALPDTAIAGETLMLDWVGPDYHLDYLSTANPGDRGGQAITYSYTKGGAPMGLTMPAEPGDYEVRYVLNQGNTVVFSQMIKVTDVAISLDAPATAIAGQTLMVNWQGPNYNLDYLSVAGVGARDSLAINYSYTRDGSPLGLRMPTEPGDYELRYVLNQGNTVIARKPITITEVSATLNAPATAPAGATISIDWQGPDYHLDYLSVAEIGSRGSQSVNYAYTRDGNQLGLTMPGSPGSYELRYVLNQGNTVLSRQMIEVTPVTATLEAPDTADAGSNISVRWSGPDYHLDYLSIAEIGARGSANTTYVYTKNGSDLSMKVPDTPGQYEIRYVMRQGNTVLVKRIITVK